MALILAQVSCTKSDCGIHAVGWHLDQETLDNIEAILAETITDPVGPELMASRPRRQH